VGHRDVCTLVDPEYQRYIEARFTMVDEDGRRFQATSLTNPLCEVTGSASGGFGSVLLSVPRDPVVTQWSRTGDRRTGPDGMNTIFRDRKAAWDQYMRGFEQLAILSRPRFETLGAHHGDAHPLGPARNLD
jgi:hypothetical protein